MSFTGDRGLDSALLLIPGLNSSYQSPTKPVSQYAVEDLLACGIKEIAFVLGDVHPEKVREHYGDGSTHGTRFTYIPQEEPLGIAHAIGLCREFVQDSPFVGRPMLESLNICSTVKASSTNPTRMELSRSGESTKHSNWLFTSSSSQKRVYRPTLDS